MSTVAAVPFERLFPTMFAETVKELLDDAPLEPLLRRLCERLSEHLAPTSVGLTRSRDGESAEVTICALTNPSLATREVIGVDGPRWGWVSASAPISTDIDVTLLDSLADFVGWLAERHAIRRRRLDSIDRERQLIAGQLHDDSIQAMTAVSLNLQRLSRMSDADREQIERLLYLTNDAIDRLRHMMFSLHPPTLAVDGLVAALEEYLDGFIAPSGVRTVVTGDITVTISPRLEALAFRLARSAVHNSWKHAQASTIDVEVTCSDNVVRVTVHDDGVGFDVESAGYGTGHHHGSVGHAGIDYSHDLVSEVGGRYEVVSAQGVGTTVLIELPID
ncbi:MAG: ATP-binding protein [Ilumatobacteraceae bacterium]